MQKIEISRATDTERIMAESISIELVALFTSDTQPEETIWVEVRE